MESVQINLRLPIDLHSRLTTEASSKSCSVQTLIIEAIGSHFGIEVTPPAKGWKLGRPRKVEEPMKPQKRAPKKPSK